MNAVALSLVPSDEQTQEVVEIAERSPDVKEKIVAMAGFIEKIALVNGVDCDAVMKSANEHNATELRDILGLVNVTVDGTPDSFIPWYGPLDEAKQMVRDKFGAKQTSGKSPKKAGKAKAEKQKSEKAPKAAKEPKAPKAPKEIEIKEVETETVEAANFVLPEKEQRARLVPLPTHFHLEKGDPVKGTPHQVDPSRTQGCAPVMPNLELHAKTGNPYPVDVNETVQTSDKYKSFVKISHATYSHLAQLGELRGRPSPELTEAILNQAGAANNTETRLAIQDTLRDLALYGLATQTIQGRSRIFKIA